ncbi:MAG: hypothetical protein ACRDKT_05525 [Actinomycetota bacterium]
MGIPPENLEPTQPVPAAPSGANRAITPPQIALVAGLVVVLLGMLWFFFLRTPAEEEAPPPVTGEAPVVPAPTPEPTATEPDDDAPVENFELFAPRDPFEPLVSADGATAGGGDGVTDGTTDGTDDGTDGGTVTGDGTSGDADDGEDVGGHRVRVIDVFRENGRDRAQIQVDGTVYTVDEGEDFAENFRLVNAEGRCATMLFGDDEFTLCEGEEILK